MKKWSDLGTEGKVWRSIWVTFTVIIVIGIAIPADPDRGKFISESVAKIICVNAYEANAKYQADIGIFDVQRTIQNQDTWKVIVSGKLQNGFGAWQNVSASCIIYRDNKDPQNEFNYINLKGFRYHL